MEKVEEKDRNKSWDERNCIDFDPPPKSTPKPTGAFALCLKILIMFVAC